MNSRFFLSVFLILALALTACQGGVSDEAASGGEPGNAEDEVVGNGYGEAALEAISYELGDLPVDVSEEVALFSDFYSVESLVAQAEACGTNRDESYFEVTMRQMGDDAVGVYTFSYIEDSQEPTDYRLMAAPNLYNYRNIPTLEGDFGACDAGAEWIPVGLSADWLIFRSSCASGVDDGSGLPVGCLEIRENMDISF